MIKKFKLTPKRLGVILLVAHVIFVLIAAASEVNAIKDVYNLDNSKYDEISVRVFNSRGTGVYNASSDESTYFTHLGNKGDNFSAVLCVDKARRYYYYGLPSNWRFTAQKIINYGVKGSKYYTGKIADYYGTTMQVNKVDVRPANSTRSRIEIYPYEQKTLKVTHSFTVDGKRGYVYIKGDRAILYFPTSEIGGVSVEVNYLGVDKEIKNRGPAYVISKLVGAFYNVD